MACGLWLGVSARDGWVHGFDRVAPPYLYCAGACTRQSEEHKAAGGYEKLYIDCIPAVDPEANWDDSKVAELPEVLRKPLLKTADGDIEGLRSGGRSAIVFVGRQGYRLKGCVAQALRG